MLIEGLTSRVEQLTTEFQSLRDRVETLESELAAALAKNSSNTPTARSSAPPAANTTAKTTSK